MTIFEQVDNVLFTKRQKELCTVDEEQQFSPYMLNRWISMYGRKVINECDLINRYSSIFVNKNDYYKFFVSIFPKIPKKRITYFKKQKHEKNESVPNIENISKYMELSKREIKEYIDFLNS